MHWKGDMKHPPDLTKTQSFTWADPKPFCIPPSGGGGGRGGPSFIMCTAPALRRWQQRSWARLYSLYLRGESGNVLCWPQVRRKIANPFVIVCQDVEVSDWIPLWQAYGIKCFSSASPPLTPAPPGKITTQQQRKEGLPAQGLKDRGAEVKNDMPGRIYHETLHVHWLFQLIWSPYTFSSQWQMQWQVLANSQAPGAHL